MFQTGRLQVPELLQELLQPELALQVGQQGLDLAGQRRFRFKLPPEQGEPGVDQGFLFCHGGSRRVVRARVGDAAAEHGLVLVHQHGLRCRAAEIDTDEIPHAGHAAGAIRFWSIIWK